MRPRERTKKWALVQSFYQYPTTFVHDPYIPRAADSLS